MTSTQLVNGVAELLRVRVHPNAPLAKMEALDERWLCLDVPFEPGYEAVAAEELCRGVLEAGIKRFAEIKLPDFREGDSSRWEIATGHNISVRMVEQYDASTGKMRKSLGVFGTTDESGK